ncbi:rhodanese-like domain-containing protein [Chryseolinea sp. T2]|uniref:rhodanese-like domain-containing protein n=1 Tax=Chryseolinea sp. T2 TaxID=3129255 RepID=UPI003077C417
MKTYFFAVLPVLSLLMLWPAATMQHQSHLPGNTQYSNDVLLSASSVNAGPQQHQYVCSPCGNDCDKRVYDKPGNCSVCGMALIDKATIGYKDIDFEAVCARVKANPKVVLLDVRSPAEFKGTSTDVPTFGHLKNAINVNIDELEARIEELNKFKDQEVIVYCSHSHRSPRASYYLSTHGFKNVKNVSGGVSELASAAPACLNQIYVKHAH